MLEKLRQLKLDENTLVVYMPDHGYSLGQHGRFEKHCCYEAALRVPLLMRWPGHMRPGIVNRFTESVDLPPTLLDMLGVGALPDSHGQHLFRSKPRDHIFSEYLENEEACIRSERFKLIFCTGQRERKDGYQTATPVFPEPYTRLYDLQNDPGEFHDVAKDHAEVVRKFKGLMLDRFQHTHPDRGRQPSRAAIDEVLSWYLRPRDAPRL